MSFKQFVDQRGALTLLSRATGYDAGYLSRVLRGQISGSRAVVKAIAEASDSSLSDVFNYLDSAYADNKVSKSSDREKPQSTSSNKLHYSPLRRWRKAQNVTIDDLSKKIDCDKSYISRVENNHRLPSVEIAKRIETLTNGEVTAVELLALDLPTVPKHLAESPAPYTSNAVTITIPEALHEQATAYSLDIAVLIAEGGLPRLRDEVSSCWNEENAEALDANRRWIAEHGTFAEQMGLI